MSGKQLNKIYCGDCKFVMEHDIFDRGIKVDLIYLDPPFFTGAVQKGEWKPGAMEVSYDDSKKFWGDSEKQQKMRLHAPTWLVDLSTKRPEFASYLYYMFERLKWCRHVLKSTGSIYLHCDYRASHYLKMIMDEIFDADNFQNEIAWGYRIQGVGKRRWARKHENILFYAKSNKWNFNPQKERIYYRKSFFGVKKDEKGRLYSDVYVRDIWDDINALISISKELIGYPTQKPVALLERIIKASSNEGDVVLDPFCGCGTTIVAAHKLERKWIGIDINQAACMTMQKRFEKDFNFVPEVYSRIAAKVKKLDDRTFEKWVNEFYGAAKPSPDKGVDGIVAEGAHRGTPIQTKTGQSVGYSVVSQFSADILDHPKVSQPVKEAWIVSQKGFDDSARQRAYKIYSRGGAKIKLITIKKEMFEKKVTKLEENDKNAEV